ncbi:MAG TPA: DNA translocase FtsK 4TM domain-containing protein, partial [Magnetospirillum sp.]|nr:DNA translocase FtsK 4TM domain-containing protein [Magnetospirillum sp.]
MAVARKVAAKGKFLPQGAIDALRRLVVRLGGSVLLAGAGLTAAALLTADPRDPSFNTAVSGPVNNALGRFGASLADLLTQVFGLGAALAVLVAGIWGVRVIIRAQTPSLWGGRIAVLPVAVVLLAVACAVLP